MKVLYVCSEAHPLVKTGGLGDVAGALPEALRSQGVDARILIPAYPSVTDAVSLRRAAHGLKLLPGAPTAELLQGRMPAGDTPLYAADCPALFRRGGGPYQDDQGSDWPDNALRFGLLGSAAALMAGRQTPLRWTPDIVHLNDWQSGLGAAYLAQAPERTVRCVFSIHNLGFLGTFDADAIPALGLAPQGFGIHGYEFHGAISYLKAGIYYADRVTTVSPRYAEEIQTDAFGHGLQGLLRGLGTRLSGILNGIDLHAWDPATDPHLECNYTAENLNGKGRCKEALQAELGLPVAAHVPLFGLVSRLSWQKGIDLVAPALERLAAHPHQLAVLGTGSAEIESHMRWFAQRHPSRVRFVNRFDEAVAHRIEAGADAFLMPSRFEPCGLNQMYSMRYGTPPVVHRTGGLADTVVHASGDSTADQQSTGFVFDVADVNGLAWAVERCLGLYANQPAWRRLQLNGMRRDFGWARSAAAYKRLYRELAPGA